MGMIDPPDVLPPPLLLAITYAPPAIRSRLRWLLEFDLNLRTVLDRTKEPMIVQLRLAWWRDALKTEASKRPNGAPILAALATLEPDTALINAALVLTDAIEVLGCDPDPAEREAAKVQRIQALCDAYRVWVEGDENDGRKIAAAWVHSSAAMPKSLNRKWRPLSILMLAEHLDNGTAPDSALSPGLRLNWHALTGR